MPDPAPLLPFARIFSDPNFRFGAWKGGEARDGVVQTPFFAFCPEAEAFVDAACRGNWVRAEIAWSQWAAGEDFARLRADPDAMATATVQDIAHLLTTLIRGDRFNEGLLADAFETGLLHRILRRVVDLARETDGASPAAFGSGMAR